MSTAPSLACAPELDRAVVETIRDWMAQRTKRNQTVINLSAVDIHLETETHIIACLERLLRESGLHLCDDQDQEHFILCNVPNEAFDMTVLNSAHFNLLLIERLGVVGFHFPYGHIGFAATRQFWNTQNLLGLDLARFKYAAVEDGEP